jgi:hypothetical protein
MYWNETRILFCECRQSGSMGRSVRIIKRVAWLIVRPFINSSKPVWPTVDMDRKKKETRLEFLCHERPAGCSSAPNLTFPNGIIIRTLENWKLPSGMNSY